MKNANSNNNKARKKQDSSKLKSRERTKDVLDSEKMTHFTKRDEKTNEMIFIIFMIIQKLN